MVDVKINLVCILKNILDIHIQGLLLLASEWSNDSYAWELLWFSVYLQIVIVNSTSFMRCWPIVSIIVVLYSYNRGMELTKHSICRVLRLHIITLIQRHSSIQHVLLIDITRESIYLNVHVFLCYAVPDNVRGCSSNVQQFFPPK